MNLFLSHKGKWIPPLTFFLLTTQSYASSYLQNDFRDEIGKTNFQIYVDGKTEQLPLNLFDDTWDQLPKHNEENSAFGTLYNSLDHTYENFTVGIYQEKNINVNFNDGFINTWFLANQNFAKLLTKTTIGAELNKEIIKAKGEYYYVQGIYFQKIVVPSSNQWLSLKTNLIYGKELQSLNVNGSNSNQRFLLSFDYFYNYKNVISKNKDNLDTDNGLGYGFDVEYIYEKNNLYLYGGLFNLGGKIYWKDITKMHYDFDSKQIYIGDDGYNHLKPFGVGYYEFHTNYTQKLPLYYKATIDYKLNDTFSLGNNLNGYSNIVFNEPYTSVKIGNTIYKLGYVLGNDDATFGVMFEKINLFGAKIKNLNLEVSNKFGSGNDTMMGRVGFSF